MTEHPSSAHQTFLHQAALVSSSTLDTDVMLQELINLIHEHFHPDAASIALVESNNELQFRGASGDSAPQIIGMRLEPGQGIAGWVAQKGEKIWVPNVYQDKRFFKQADQNTGFKTTALLAIPVKRGARTLAVLEMINPGGDIDLEETIEIMTTLAALITPALQNAHLYEKVRCAEIRYQSLLELNPDPIIIIDDKGCLLELNNAAQALLNLAPEDCGEVVLEKLDLHAKRFAELKGKAISGQPTMWEFICKQGQTEEHTLEVRLTYHKSYPPHGAYQWLAHDITDRILLEKMREKLSNMIVHDLRIPLGNILNSLQLTLNSLHDKDIIIPTEQVLGIALRSAHRMQHLISNILDTARLQANQKSLSISAIDVKELVADVLDTVRPSLNQRNHNLVQQIQVALPAMKGDIDLLRRVLLNILDNAIKYNERHGKIVLDVHMDESDYHFSIRDNGPGISTEDRKQAFEIFTRGKIQKATGSGIGLAFCKLAIEAHGGKIWLESAVDEGTIVFFTIPRNLPASITREQERSA